MKKILIFCVICFATVIVVSSFQDAKSNQDHSSNFIIAGAWKDFKKGFKQGASESSQGRKLIGNVSSQEACYNLAVSAGCSNTYSWYRDTGNCFCN